MRAKFINEGEYWDRSSKHYEEYEDLYDELVPAQGEANTLQGELLRMISRLSHDYYNNGFGNNKEAEARFLDDNSRLFQPYMKNPDHWDQFYEGYRMGGFGEGAEEDGGYEEYNDETGEYEWIDEEETTSTSEYMEKVLGMNIDKLLDDITDGVVKYVKMTYHDLKPIN